MKVASVAPPGTPWAKQLQDVKLRIEGGSGGRIDVKAFMGGALGDEIATAEATKRGAIQVFGGTAGALASAVPELAVVELPYLFPHVAKADHVLDNVIRADLEELLWERGFKLLFFSENGWRSVGTNFGFVRSTEDLAGRKMRSMESEVHLATWRAMGASPVPVAVTEVLSALQTKLVVGFDNTALFTFAASWYQAITHFTLTEHSYQPGLVVASRVWWETLPKDLQAVVAGDGQAEAVTGRKGVRDLEPLLLKNFENASIQVAKLTAEERKAFARATEPVHAKFVRDAGPRAKKLLAKIRAAL
jgi:TRAP-type C4-dicarboxylate transport system substrate-binding protein